LAENNPDAILVVDGNNMITFANPAAEELFHFGNSELIGSPFNKSLQSGRKFELTLDSKQRGKIFLEAQVSSINWNNQKASLVILRDISRHKQLEDKFTREKDYLKSVLDGLMDPITVTDCQCRIHLMNRAAEELLNTHSAETNWPLRCSNSGQKPVENCRDEALCPLAVVLRTANPTLSTWELKLKENQVRYFESQVTPLCDNRGKVLGVIEASRDITDRVMLEAGLQTNQNKMKSIALHDALTGLPNRLLFKDRLQHAIAQARRKGKMLALFFMDLDRFKDINESLGHSSGDFYLQEIASRLDGCIRESDTVARLGGDEFVVLLEDVKNRQSVAKVADGFLGNLSRTMMIEHQVLSPSASIGISLFPANADNPEDLMKCAVNAMCLAKEKGRGAYQFFTPELDQRSDKMLTLETALRRAIESEQLRLHYQPQFDMRTGKPVGFEALLRWEHPVKGAISPDDIIPVAEDTGLILPLGSWVLHHACQQHANWLRQGMPAVRMAVNISPDQFHHGMLLETVKKALLESGLDPRFLELEITESSIMLNTAHAIEVMHQLRNIGVTLAIDDFGAGFSSLLRLKDFPISKIKIDRAFIRTLGENENTHAITGAIVTLADNLGMEVIAEGVETDHQADALRRIGCHLAQGYLYGRPQPAAIISEMMESWITDDRPQNSRTPQSASAPPHSELGRSIHVGSPDDN